MTTVTHFTFVLNWITLREREGKGVSRARLIFLEEEIGGCIEGRESASRRICERVCEVEQMMLSGRLI